MKKLIGLMALILCLASVFGIAAPAAAASAYNYGQGRDLTGVEFVKITQADITLDASNPGIPAFVKTSEVCGYLWDLNFVPVREIPPVFSYVWVGGCSQTMQIAQVRPIYNYGENLDMFGIECVKVSRADIVRDPSPSNVGIPAYAKKAIVPGGAIICGYVWDLNFKPVLEIPPVGGYVIIGYGMTLYLAQVVD